MGKQKPIKHRNPITSLQFLQQPLYFSISKVGYIPKNLYSLGVIPLILF